jgi:hypothetical protein
VAKIGKRKNAYRVLMVKPVSKTSCGMPKSRWENNIKMDLKGDRLGRRG